MLSNQSPFDNAPQRGIAQQGNSNSRFSGSKFLFKRQVLKLIGAAFFVHDEGGNVVLYADQKAFKIKEDIRVYSGEDKKTEVMRIAARSIMDFSAAYDVFDSATNQKLGALRRAGLKSMMRDEWQILDANDRQIGGIVEDSLPLALLRRFIEFTALIFPQKYSITVGSQAVGHFAQTHNPLNMQIQADFGADTSGVLDRRLGLAAGVLMCAIEGKQG